MDAFFDPDRHEPPQGRAWDAGVAADAIVQSDAEAASLGQRRHSLWAGDPGVA